MALLLAPLLKHKFIIMKTIKVVLNLNVLSALQKTAFADVVLTSMAGNVNFVSPYPTLSTLGLANTDLKAAIATAGLGSVIGMSAVRAKENELARALRAIASYVEYESNNNESVALTSGFELKQSVVRTAKSFNATQGLHSGTVDLETKYENNSSYIWEVNTDPINDLLWKQFAVSVQSKHTVVGLNPATKYWFRVSIVNKEGQQPYSDPHFVLVV